MSGSRALTGTRRVLTSLAALVIGVVSLVNLFDVELSSPWREALLVALAAATLWCLALAVGHAQHWVEQRRGE